MKTLYADTAADWAIKLAKILAALELAEKAVPTANWDQVWSAKIDGRVMLARLLQLTCGDVAVEPAANLERAA